MRPLNLQEFAEALRLSGDNREVDFADMILQLLALEDEVAEPYSDLLADLEHYAPKEITDPVKQLEWIGDRSDLLKEIETALEEADRKPKGTDDAADVVKAALGTLEEAGELLMANGWDGDGDFLEALSALCDKVPPPELEYDL